MHFKGTQVMFMQTQIRNSAYLNEDTALASEEYIESFEFQHFLTVRIGMVDCKLQVNCVCAKM